MKNVRFYLAAVKPIARCGYDEYTISEKVFRADAPGERRERPLRRLRPRP